VLLHFLYRVFRKIVFFPIHCNQSPVCRRLISLLLDEHVQPITAEFWGRERLQNVEHSLKKHNFSWTPWTPCMCCYYVWIISVTGLFPHALRPSQTWSMIYICRSLFLEKCVTFIIIHNHSFVPKNKMVNKKKLSDHSRSVSLHFLSLHFYTIKCNLYKKKVYKERRTKP